MTPRVTVVIAAYNCAAALRCAIASVLDQTLEDFELKVIGDGCTDASGGVVSSFTDPRVSWTNLPRNTGSQAEPNNEGVRQARGRYIAYLGQDDLWLPDHLETLVARIESTGASLVHAMGARIGPEGVRSLLGPLPPSQTYATFHVPPTTWLHRIELVERVGPWPDHRRLSSGVDACYFRTIASANQLIAFSPSLTALKLPALLFRIYARTDSPPQSDYLEAMRSDLEAFRAKLLTDLALLPSSERSGSAALRLGRRSLRLYRRLMSRLANARGRPLGLDAARVRRFQERRRQALIKKGLPGR